MLNVLEMQMSGIIILGSCVDPGEAAPLNVEPNQSAHEGVE